MRDERNDPTRRELDQAVNQRKLRRAVLVLVEGEPVMASLFGKDLRLPVEFSDFDRDMLQAMRISRD